MDVTFLARGLAVGFSIAAPVGPIGLLCIRRTLADGRASGLATGLGAAAADAAYGAVAAFGLAAVSGPLAARERPIRLVGGAFLLWLGVRAFTSRPAERAAKAAGPVAGRAAAFASTFFLTLSNPATILSFGAIFAGMGLGAASGGKADAAAMTAGVFAGSAAWWLFLTWAVSRFERRVGPAQLAWINKLSGLALAAFGLLALRG